MTKQEILEAINATIVTNGQKGITAESLANILTEMTNAAGEGGSGGGDGLLKLYVPDAIFAEAFLELGGFNMANWATIKAEYAQLEEFIPGITAILDEYELVMSDYIASNAALYQTILSKAQTKDGIAVLTDMSKAFSLSYQIMMFSVIGAAASVDLSMSSVGTVMAMSDEIEGANFMIQTKIYESLGGPTEAISGFELNPDGTLQFITSNKEFVLSIPINDTSLGNTEIASNNTFVSDIYRQWFPESKMSQIKVMCYDNGNSRYQKPINLLTANIQETTFTATYFEGTSLKQIVIDATAGTTTVTTLGTFNTTS